MGGVLVGGWGANPTFWRLPLSQNQQRPGWLGDELFNEQPKYSLSLRIRSAVKSGYRECNIRQTDLK